jgi:single-strand DNA-binding protein
MSKCLNKVMLIGNLGRDPEMRYTPSGRAVTTFPLATTRNWKSTDGEQHSETEWFNIVVWGSLAEICKKCLQKGQSVYIEGRVQTRRWEDQEGLKHLTIEVIANDMLMFSDHKESSSQSSFDNDLDVGEYPF